MKFIVVVIMVFFMALSESNADLTSNEVEELSTYEMWFHDGKKWVSLDITIGQFLKYILYLFPADPPHISKGDDGVIIKILDKELLLTQSVALISPLDSKPKVIYTPVSLRSKGGTFDEVGAASFIWQVIYDSEAKMEEHRRAEEQIR